MTLNPYHQPFMVQTHALSTIHPMLKITQSAINRKPINQKKKKNLPLENIFLHLYTSFGVKIQNTNGQKSLLNFFDMCKLTLHSPANSPEVTYSKIQNRLSRAPWDTPMDRFLMQYISNKCALILCESVKKWYSTFNGP